MVKYLQHAASGIKFLSRVRVSEPIAAYPAYQSQPLEWHMPGRTWHVGSFPFYFRYKWVYWQLKTFNIQFPWECTLNSKPSRLLLTIFQGQRHAVPSVKCVTVPNIAFLSPQTTERGWVKHQSGNYTSRCWGGPKIFIRSRLGRAFLWNTCFQLWWQEREDQGLPNQPRHLFSSLNRH